MDRVLQWLRDAGHPKLAAFINKVMKDNIGALASIVSWALLTSLVPVLAGLVAISGLVLQSRSAQHSVVTHLSQALQGILTSQDLANAVHAAVHHTGLFGVIGFIGIIWGGSNVGGAIATVFQPVFQVRGRFIVHEKLLDVAMIVAVSVLMIVIVAATTAASLADRLFSNFPFSEFTTLILGTVISLVASFILFALIYTVFPNVETHFKLRNVWPGAVVAALLFQILTYMWPIYTHVFHFSRYGAILLAIILLTAWIYFFSLILLIGAEFVAFRAIEQAKAAGQEVGPAPDGTVPQRIAAR